MQVGCYRICCILNEIYLDDLNFFYKGYFQSKIEEKLEGWENGCLEYARRCLPPLLLEVVGQADDGWKCVALPLLINVMSC